ncbi:MAG: N-acetyl-gamma-glutamyl-phosphate reductase [Candidatus Sumerlaeia bacterium]
MERIGIVGATGYTGRELIRILLRHRGVELTYLAGRVETPTPLESVFPEFRGAGLEIRPLDMDLVIDATDICFVCLPHKEAMEHVRELREAEHVTIDLSADFRFADPNVYEAVYGVEHTAREFVAEAVYGLPEIYREQLKEADLIACPGCYPTSILLALAPLRSTNLVHWRNIIADSKSGVSGAGRKPTETTHFHEANEDIKPYKVGTHRHQPEIEERLSEWVEQRVSVCFVPHLAPMDRGILSTIYVPLAQSVEDDTIREIYDNFYSDEPFIRLLPAGQLPRTKAVAFTNNCDIALTVLPAANLLVITSAIDNLIKGASGQAVQCFNVRVGYSEKEGLI